MSSILKIGDIYKVEDDDMVITHLFERTRSKGREPFIMNPVKVIDLDDVPPPRKNLHQNRYGRCELGDKKMFMKILSPGFYKRSKKWYNILKPYAKDLYVESHFDNERRIITQPKMKYHMTATKLEDDNLDNTIQKIKDFLKRIKKYGDNSVLNCFDRMDISVENFMIDHKKENFYMVDFDPWPKSNPIGSWHKIIRELKNKK